MTLISAKTPRADLVTRLKAVTILTTEAGGQAHVFPYLVDDPKGISPYACVETAHARYPIKSSPASSLAQFRYVVGIWARRDDPATNEDDVLDDLSLELARILIAMHNADYFSDPESGYETIAGVPYKFCLHFVEINR